MTKGGLLCFSAFEKQRQRSLAVSSCEFQFLQLPFFYSFFNAKLMILIIFVSGKFNLKNEYYESFYTSKK